MSGLSRIGWSLLWLVVMGLALLVLAIGSVIMLTGGALSKLEDVLDRKAKGLERV